LGEVFQETTKFWTNEEDDIEIHLTVKIELEVRTITEKDEN